MVYATTLNESQKVMRWQLILEGFGPNIQHISGVDNIVPATLSILSYTSVKKYEPITIKDQRRSYELFAIGEKKYNKEHFSINILNMQREQQKHSIKVNSKLSAYILDWGSGYSKKALNKVKII